LRVIFILELVATASWRRAHGKLLDALAEREAGRTLGREWRLMRPFHPGLIWWTYRMYLRRGLSRWFAAPHPDPKIEQLRLKSVALYKTARYRTYAVAAVGAAGIVLIFVLTEP